MSTVTTHDSQSATHGAPPRKRRRKTVSGATDDCFTCRNRNTPCDRKRPYCSQCIAIGRECSGYKTTLTWGVGVASRGKLRGKSTPVATKSANAGVVSPTTTEAKRRKSSAGKVKDEKQVVEESSVNRQAAPPYLPTYQQALPTITAGQTGWHVPDDPSPLSASQANAIRPSILRHHALQHIHTTFGPQYDTHSIPESGSSVGSFPDSDYHSPLEFPQPPGHLQFAQSLPHQHTSVPFTSQPLYNPIDPYLDQLSSSIDTLQTVASYPEVPTLESDTRSAPGTFAPPEFDHDELILRPGFDMSLTHGSFDYLDHNAEEEEADFESKAISLMDTRFAGSFFHMPQRMQSLMEYYDRHVCTYLVAFDGPDNPYRNILQLASQNDALQNAIAALAINNLRMRRKGQPRQIGFIEGEVESFVASPSSSELDEPSAEENCYKQMSIDQLNMQLTGPRAAHDDSVLATLLILCLFHVCDSGFSKFKTQLAGVQKLLSLRNPHEQSDFTGWVEMFFIWFDVMTSAVNDRSLQITGKSLDLLDYSSNLGALEQFSGCDGRLFKLIARLGHLNLLAQGKAVRPQDSKVRNSVEPKRQSFSSTKRSWPRSVSAADFANMDGNGWGYPIVASDDEQGNSPQDNESARLASDDRDDFWMEWNDVRQRLHAWRMESISPPPPSTPGTEFEMGQRDLLHINESFRYSALLYTERLGHPLLPSSHPSFQNYVHNALFHITSLEVTSCVNKFLLWPLFIIGTECVSEAHRNIIRSRCIEVAKESGFYNNISGLEVLERVWQEVGHNVQGMEAAEVRARRRDSEAGKTGRYGQAFRWRKAMDRVDGEYILI